MGLKSELKKYFGFEEFKGRQEEIINSLLEGNDTFVLMPTGGGKSLCYQLPALISDGLAIIISPLIALMKNQVDVIRGISENEGIAHVLNSSLSKAETNKVMEDIDSGITKLLFMAPESLTKEEHINFLKQYTISFFAIDEAHCISEWGHDFRPEYRNIKEIIGKIGKAPIITLTATATPKVQEDIQKNLGMQDAKVFKDSFNRPNLFYEVRPKIDVDKEIIKFIKNNPGKSGIVYCLSRKKVEEVAQILQVNDINTLPYHAGFDSKTRAKHQDMFLMEDIDVIVATIAFGMGIDKPDVRFVIHYDIPKSLESYYQETGRAGRDGGEGYCLAFYNYKDIEKLEKFLAGKPVSEREIGMQLLNEMVAYAETSGSRRKFILHYFGEEFDEINGKGADMDDNMRNPKKRIDAQNEALTLLNVINKTHQILKIKELTNTLIGNETAIIKSYKISQEDFFGIGKEKDKYFWTTVIRQALVHNYLKKEIESYGVIKVTKKGEDFIQNPIPFMIAEDRNYADLQENTASSKVIAAFDQVLLNQLKKIRKKVAHQNSIPPFAVFQDLSLDDMATRYPTTLDEMKDIFGVGEGKAKKFGKLFVEFIAKYVEENNIERPDDLVVRQLIKNSNHKVYIIQSTDRKLNLEDIAKNKGLQMEELIKEMESIVYQGTKLNIDYYLNEILDEDQQEEIFNYFMEAETDKITDAYHEFEEEFSEEELRLMRIKFFSEVAN
ncbi:MAG: DNA helicase RecQ [Flavobacteriales bacterium]